MTSLFTRRSLASTSKLVRSAPPGGGGACGRLIIARTSPDGNSHRVGKASKNPSQSTSASEFRRQKRLDVGSGAC
eukprot:1205092-Pyramimonas_sp.AAC.1